MNRGEESKGAGRPCDPTDGDEPAEADGRAHTAATTGSGLLLADRRETEQQDATTQHLSRVRVVCADALRRRDSDRLPRSRRSCWQPVGEEPGWQGGAKLPESSLSRRGRRLEDRVRPDSN